MNNFQVASTRGWGSLKEDEKHRITNPSKKDEHPLILDAKGTSLEFEEGKEASFDFPEFDEQSEDILDLDDIGDLRKALEHSQILIQEYQECIMRLDGRLQEEEEKNAKLTHIISEFDRFFKEEFARKYQEVQKTVQYEGTLPSPPFEDPEDVDNISEEDDEVAVHVPTVRRSFPQEKRTPERRMRTPPTNEFDCSWSEEVLSPVETCWSPISAAKGSPHQETSRTFCESPYTSSTTSCGATVADVTSIMGEMIAESTSFIRFHTDEGGHVEPQEDESACSSIEVVDTTTYQNTNTANRKNSAAVVHTRGWETRSNTSLPDEVAFLKLERLAI